MNNKLFVANKPLFVSSNQFLGRIKKNIKLKKQDFQEHLTLLQKGA